jgi:hypothetical protein
MSGIEEIRQLDDTTMHWVANIGGVKREWKARIVEQVPNEKVAWAATEGATNAGAVYFASTGAGQTTVRLELEYEPEGVVETAADKIGLVGRRVEGDLNKFKSFIEDAGYASGAWRGTVPGAGGTPGVEAAQGSKGDSGSAGISGKAALAGAGAVAAAAGVAAAAAKAKSGSDEPSTGTPVTAPSTTPITEPVPSAADPTGPPATGAGEPIPPADPGGSLDPTPIAGSEGSPNERCAAAA